MSTAAERHSIDLPSGRFAYLASGEAGAPLVVCLHGFPDHAGTFRDLLGALSAAGFRAVAPWLRGYAPSTLAGPYTMSRIVDDLLELADALSPGVPVHVVGHDWGAVATWYALGRAPERFGRAVTIAVPHLLAFLENVRRHPRQLRRSWYMALFQIPWVAERAVARDHFALIHRLWRDWSPGFVPDADHMHDLERCLAESMPAPIEYYRAARRRDRELERATRAIRVPVLYLHGKNDGCVGPELCEGQARFMDAELRVEVLEGVGHFLHLEAPRKTAELVVEWFRATGTGG